MDEELKLMLADYMLPVAVDPHNTDATVQKMLIRGMTVINLLSGDVMTATQATQSEGNAKLAEEIKSQLLVE